MLAASSGKRNVAVWRPSVRPSVQYFSTLNWARRTYSTWRTSGSTRRGQCAFSTEYYEDEHNCDENDLGRLIKRL